MRTPARSRWLIALVAAVAVVSIATVAAATRGGSDQEHAGDGSGQVSAGSPGDPDAPVRIDPDAPVHDCNVAPLDRNADPDSPVDYAMCPDDQDPTPMGRPEHRPAGRTDARHGRRAGPAVRPRDAQRRRHGTILFTSGVEPCAVLDHVTSMKVITSRSPCMRARPERRRRRLHRDRGPEVGDRSRSTTRWTVAPSSTAPPRSPAYPDLVVGNGPEPQPPVHRTRLVAGMEPREIALGERSRRADRQCRPQPERPSGRNHRDTHDPHGALVQVAGRDTHGFLAPPRDEGSAPSTPRELTP